MSFIIYILNIQLKHNVRAAYITNLIHLVHWHYFIHTTQIICLCIIWHIIQIFIQHWYNSSF